MAARNLAVAKIKCGLCLLLLSLAIVCSSTIESAAAPRKALIIANGEYEHITNLINPENDGRLIEAKLKTAGFDVRFERNLTGTRISQVVHAFARSLTPDMEAVVYYAGHGIQVGGNSLMVGVDATLSSGDALVHETHGLLELTALLERRAGIALVFWDACRDIPVAMKQPLQLLSDGGSLTLDSGAAQWPERHSTGNSIVMYATGHGCQGRQRVQQSVCGRPCAAYCNSEPANQRIPPECRVGREAANKRRPAATSRFRPAGP